MIDYDRKSWFSIVLQMRGSVFPLLLPRVFIAMVIGAGSALAYIGFGFKIPTIAHTLIGVALGLLLVFRTNASYDRWWEGRKLLGTMVNRTRDLSRQTRAYVCGEDRASQERAARIGRWTAAFYVLLTQSLRDEKDLSALGTLLTEQERGLLEPRLARPTIVAAWISQLLASEANAGRLTEPRLQLMDQNLTVMIDALGGAERIVRTPIPFAYAQHIKTFVVLFCYSAPFAMVDTMRWATPVAAGILAFALFGIDEIGVEIEDPFGYDDNDLPLDRIGKTIERGIGDVLATGAPTADANPPQLG